VLVGAACRADPVAAGQFSWPPAGSYLAVYGQFLVAVVTPVAAHAGPGWSSRMLPQPPEGREGFRPPILEPEVPLEADVADLLCRGRGTCCQAR
jgi:hypothetical protein